MKDRASQEMIRHQLKHKHLIIKNRTRKDPANHIYYVYIHLHPLERDMGRPKWLAMIRKHYGLYAADMSMVADQMRLVDLLELLTQVKKLMEPCRFLAEAISRVAESSPKVIEALFDAATEIKISIKDIIRKVMQQDLWYDNIHLRGVRPFDRLDYGLIQPDGEGGMRPTRLGTHPDRARLMLPAPDQSTTQGQVIDVDFRSSDSDE